MDNENTPLTYTMSHYSFMELCRVHRRIKGLIHELEKQKDSDMDVLDLDEIQNSIGQQLAQIQLQQE